MTPGGLGRRSPVRHAVRSRSRPLSSAAGMEDGNRRGWDARFMDNGRARARRTAGLIERADTIDFSLVSPHLTLLSLAFFCAAFRRVLQWLLASVDSHCPPGRHGQKTIEKSSDPL